MEGRIDPPSSMHQMTEEKMRQTNIEGEIWAIGSSPIACVVLTPQPKALYVGRLAVEPDHLGQGHARTLLEVAETRAHALGLPALELEVRIELTENHAFFRTMGFTKTGENSHTGYDRVTSLTFAKTVPG